MDLVAPPSLRLHHDAYVLEVRIMDGREGEKNTRRGGGGGVELC